MLRKIIILGLGITVSLIAGVIMGIWRSSRQNWCLCCLRQHLIKQNAEHQTDRATTFPTPPKGGTTT